LDYLSKIHHYEIRFCNPKVLHEAFDGIFNARSLNKNVEQNLKKR